MPYNVYDASCPTRNALDRISDKWSILVIDYLAKHDHRFSELLKAIGGISQKMLTETLRKLERDGLVTRSVNSATIPISVTYALTPAGRALSTPIAAIRAWAEQHIETILASRREYDSGIVPGR